VKVTQYTVVATKSDAIKEASRRFRQAQHAYRMAEQSNPYGAKKRRSRLAAPGVKPGSQAHGPGWYVPPKAYPCAANTAERVEGERRMLDWRPKDGDDRRRRR